jgi:Tfp pilus assembly protein PilN
MPSVNLIPPVVLVQRRRRLRLKRWGCVCVVTWLLALWPVVRESMANGQLQDRQVMLSDLAVGLERFREETVSSDGELAAMATIVDRARELNSKRPWSGLLEAIGEAMPNGVWMQVISTDPPRVSPDGGALGAAIKKDEEDEGIPLIQSGSRTMQLEGYALGLEDIYKFMTALSKLELFTDTRLRNVQEAELLDRRVTRFSLSCEW